MEAEVATEGLLQVAFHSSIVNRRYLLVDRLIGSGVAAGGGLKLPAPKARGRLAFIADPVLLMSIHTYK